MKPQYEQQLAELAKELVTPERYGALALEGALAPDERVLTEALPFYAVPYEPEDS